MASERPRIVRSSWPVKDPVSKNKVDSAKRMTCNCPLAFTCTKIYAPTHTELKGGWGRGRKEGKERWRKEEGREKRKEEEGKKGGRKEKGKKVGRGRERGQGRKGGREMVVGEGERGSREGKK